MATDKPPESARITRLLRRADQITIAALTLFALLALAGYAWHHYAQRGRLIEIDRVDPLAVKFQVDINTADWAELITLPEVGETLAKRIVEYRQQHGAYQSVGDLVRVRGIGPKTMERLRPFLLPIPPRQVAEK